MFKTIFVGALALLTVPAFAQTAPEPFNGAFVGVQGGWQQDRQTLRATDGGLQSRSTNKNDGFAYGGQIGYDFKLSPSTVLGAEVSLTGRTGRGVLDDGVDFVELSQGRTINATGRLGYLVSPDALVYARGGYANTQYRIDDGASRITENRDGYTVGAGYEQMLATNVSARLEYNYADFGKDELPFVAAGLGADDAELKYTRHAVTAGLNFRF